jgi:hypothetical protein
MFPSLSYLSVVTDKFLAVIYIFLHIPERILLSTLKYSFSERDMNCSPMCYSVIFSNHSRQLA